MESGEHLDYCIGVHAEINAIIQCAINGVSTTDATIYCTNYPCSDCLKALINAGIKRIVYIDGYPNINSDFWITNMDNKIDIVKIDPDKISEGYSLIFSKGDRCLEYKNCKHHLGCKYDWITNDGCQYLFNIYSTSNDPMESTNELLSILHKKEVLSIDDISKQIKFPKECLQEMLCGLEQQLIVFKTDTNKWQKL
jgi:hypothetical protein